MNAYTRIYVYRLQNSMALVDMEKIRNNRIKASDIDLSPEFKKIIENVKSQIKQLDVSQNSFNFLIYII